MYQVTKHIDFCYGHRLLDYEGPCKHLHGHNGRVEIDLRSVKLDHRGMVYDFGDIKRQIKAWIDETLDHRMLLNKQDPVLPTLRQMGERFFLMDENPTAENIAKMIFEHAQQEGLPIIEVRLWETPSSFASYRG